MVIEGDLRGDLCVWCVCVRMWDVCTRQVRVHVVVCVRSTSIYACRVSVRVVVGECVCVVRVCARVRAGLAVWVCVVFAIDGVRGGGYSV